MTTITQTGHALAEVHGRLLALKADIEVAIQNEFNTHGGIMGAEIARHNEKLLEFKALISSIDSAIGAPEAERAAMQQAAE